MFSAGPFKSATIVCAFTLIISCLVPQLVRAGTTGTITGTITDAASGAPVANVRITAVAPSGRQSTTSNTSGFYSLQQMIPDTYTVSFESEGYQPSAAPGITVQQDLTTKLDQRLE